MFSGGRERVPWEQISEINTYKDSQNKCSKSTTKKGKHRKMFSKKNVYKDELIVSYQHCTQVHFRTIPCVLRDENIRKIDVNQSEKCVFHQCCP